MINHYGEELRHKREVRKEALIDGLAMALLLIFTIAATATILRKTGANARTAISSITEEYTICGDGCRLK